MQSCGDLGNITISYAKLTILESFMLAATTIFHGNLRYPPQGHPPPGNKALLRDYENPLVSLIIRPAIRAGYFLGGVA